MVRRAKANGFTLVEVVVALAIVAVLGAVIMQTLGASLRGQDRAERMTIAVLVAESKMAEVGASIPLVAGSLRGTAADVPWQIRIVPYRGLPAPTLAIAPVLAYEVEVAAEWASGRDDRVVLRTVRLAPRASDG